jgi:hypothetical protein
MKKLLLVLMVVALASFLFVGCFPVTPAEGEGEGEGEAELCPAITLSGGVDVAGKTYIKAGKEQTITLTFGTVTEPVNLFVGPCNEKGMPTGVPESSTEVILRTTDKKVYTGTYVFSGECCELYLYTMYGTGEVICKYPVIVDGEGPYAKIEVTVDECLCVDCAVTFTSEWTVSGDCEDTVGCCDDDCSGFASWAIDIYDEFPFDECCTLQCAEPVDGCSGTECPVDCTTECLEAGEYWVIINLADKVGNETRYIASLEFDEDCELISGTEYDEANICEDCIPSLPMDGFIGACDTDPVEWLGCEEEELEVCPEVTFVPETPIVGQETTITIDFTGKEAPAGIVSAYVGPSIKTLPLGVPEDAQELVLTQAGLVYTATYTFGQAGTDYIYVTLGCEDCTPCKTGVTVLPTVCPDILVEGEIEYESEMIVAGGAHEITVVFEVPTEGVRVFVKDENTPDDWDGGLPIPDDAEEIDMTTTDNMTFTGVWVFDGDCDVEWIYVLSGESCCPVVCTRTVLVDGEAPCFEITALVEECEVGGPCPPITTGEKIIITNDPATYPEEPCEAGGPCCCDDCTEVVGWDMTIYCMNPYHLDDCCDTIDPLTICYEASGTGCDISFTTPCLSEDILPHGDGEPIDYWYVYFSVVDFVGNENSVWGRLWKSAPGVVHFEQGTFVENGGCDFVLDIPPFPCVPDWIGDRDCGCCPVCP